ncbi:MAG: T9SS type A sorting domain-containing protein, partial [Bacteroidota bacterium]|nr:T9SS type A sorting domain-containing protein [Bacteroidota bacterium]
RSKHIGSVQQSEIDSIFARANRGIDQVACLWGHLPETDFLTNLKRVDSLIHKSAAKFPNPKFRYCTATEAMQRWLKVTDNKAPLLQVTGHEQNGKIHYEITTDEAIFQKQPFVAVKDIYERYTILNCQKTGDNSWQSESTDKAILAKAGFAVTDTSGNLTKKLINYLPNDAFVDNDASASITVNSGTWTKITDHSCFDISYLKSTVDASAGASLSVKAPIAQAGKYNLFVQFAKVDNHADSLFVLISKGSNLIDTVILKGKIDLRSWIYLTTITSNDTTPVDVKISTGGKTESGKIVAFDALKVSPLVRDKEIFIRTDFADLGDVIVEKETNFTVDITNKGTDPLQVTSISVSGNNTKVNALVPFTIGSLQTYSLPLKVTPGKLGLFTDTLFVASSDPVKPVIKVIVKANSVNYFTIIDNDETANYKESGTWNFSNAKAFGNTSRYASLGQKPGARAIFTKLIEKTGTYDVMQILPETVNASSHVLYIFSINNLVKDSVYIDQNMNSGSWVKLTTRYIQSGAEAKLEIVDNGGNTVSGAVLRSDAVRFNFISATGIAEEGSSLLPKEYALHQNYPNPFNPSTVIAYSLPRTSEVTVKIYDILGHEVTTLFNGMQSAGKYSLRFDAQQMGSRLLSSGVYFYNLKAVPAGGGETFFSTLKMMYIK